VLSQTALRQTVTIGTMLQAPESQKLWLKVRLSTAQELAQTVVDGRAVQEPLAPQAWHVGQAETSQQKPFVQLPVVH
jgi:hypothetical protein